MPVEDTFHWQIKQNKLLIESLYDCCALPYEGKNVFFAGKKPEVRRRILCKLKMAWSRTEAIIGGFTLQIRTGESALITTVRGYGNGMRAFA